MSMSERLSALVLALFAVGGLDAQAPPPSNRPHFAFVVIGPTPEIRGWTSEWVQAVVDRAANDSTRRIAPWRNVLGWLDTEAEPFDSLPPFPSLWSASGPWAPPSPAAAVYPADLRRPLPLSDLRQVLRSGRLESFTQVVVTKGIFGYRVVATTVERREDAAAVQRSARGRRLKLAAEQAANSFSLDWRPAHAGSVPGTR